MKIENGNIQFEYLSAVGSSSIGDDAPVTVKLSATSFYASNTQLPDIMEFVQMGRNAVNSFNKLFAYSVHGGYVSPERKVQAVAVEVGSSCLSLKNLPACWLSSVGSPMRA